MTAIITYLIRIIFYKWSLVVKNTSTQHVWQKAFVFCFLFIFAPNVFATSVPPMAWTYPAGDIMGFDPALETLKIEKKEIKTGLSDGINVEILEGLSQGEEVVENPPKEIK